MQQFAFFEEKLIGKELVFVDLSSVIRSGDPGATLDAITERVEQEEPAIVVIDSFKALRDILAQGKKHGRKQEDRAQGERDGHAVATSVEGAATLAGSVEAVQPANTIRTMAQQIKIPR